MNSIIERWVQTACREILDRTLIWNHAHLRPVLTEFEDHYNRARPHRALRQASPLTPLPEPVDLDQIWVRRHDRLGCLIREYRQVA
jgi:putative transposase